MCFAPQRRALFRHLNFQKWSENGVFCTFWLRNVLRATTACNFSSLIWPAGSAPAALASLLFDPPEPQIIGKHSVSRLSYLFAHLHLLSSDSFSSLIFSLLIFLFSLPLPYSAFHLYILSEVWLLNFLRLITSLSSQFFPFEPVTGCAVLKCNQKTSMVIGRSWDGHGNDWAKENEAILLHHRRFFLMFVGFRWFAGAPGAPSSHTEACSRFWQNTMRSSNVAERLLLCGFLGFEDLGVLVLVTEVLAVHVICQSEKTRGR